MDTIKMFERHGLVVQEKTTREYYPGSCDQCGMKKAASDSLLIGITPDLRLLICAACYSERRETIRAVLATLAEKTGKTRIDAGRVYMAPGQAEVSGWKIDPRYKVFPVRRGTIYVPLVHPERRPCLVPGRPFCLLNDLAL